MLRVESYERLWTTIAFMSVSTSWRLLDMGEAEQEREREGERE